MGGGGGPNFAVLLIFFVGGCLVWDFVFSLPLLDILLRILPKVQEKSSLLTFTSDNMVCRHKS